MPNPGPTLLAEFTSQYVVKSKINDTDYIIKMPDWRHQKRLCHVNMLKQFHCRENAKKNSTKEKSPEPTSDVSQFVIEP